MSVQSSLPAQRSFLAASVETETPTFQGRLDFEQRLRPLRNRIYNLAYRNLRHIEDAEDVTQETICRAWRHFGRFDSARSLEAWLTRIAVNLCIETVRRRQRQRTVSLDTPSVWNLDGEPDGRQLEDSRQDPCLRLMEAAVDENLVWALHSLPASYLRCVQLLEQNHSYAEIGALLGCPIGTIRSRLFRARALIRKRLESKQTN